MAIPSGRRPYDRIGPPDVIEAESDSDTAWHGNSGCCKPEDCVGQASMAMHLNSDCALHVLSFLDTPSLLALALTSSTGLACVRPLLVHHLHLHPKPHPQRA